MIGKLLSGVLQFALSKYMIILIGGAILVCVVSIYRAGQNHATLKIQSTINQKVKDGHKKVKRKVQAKTKKDTHILKDIKELQDAPPSRPDNPKEAWRKKRKKILDKINRL